MRVHLSVVLSTASQNLRTPPPSLYSKGYHVKKNYQIREPVFLLKDTAGIQQVTAETNPNCNIIQKPITGKVNSANKSLRVQEEEIRARF